MRYLRTDTVLITKLKAYPGNARVHDDAALDESAKLNGQYRSIVVRTMPNADTFQVLAGHGTLAAFKRAGDKSVRVEIIEADDTEARRIVLVDNGASRNASYDESALLALLDAASADGGLDGTGWDGEALAKLLDGNENPFDEQLGTDDTDQLPSGWHVLVTCEDEEQQIELLDRFVGEGLIVKALSA